MAEDIILAGCACGNDGGCSSNGCTGDVNTCKADPCCKKSDSAEASNKKDCDTCGTELKGGMKYTDICTTCEPIYTKWCSGCERRLWSCMCIKPHTWE